MKKVLESYKNASLIVKIAVISLLLTLVADIVFIIVDGKDMTFTLGCFIAVLIGSLIGIMEPALFHNKTCLLVSSLLFAIGIGFHVHKALPSISDLWNHVNFVGGNQMMAIIFGSIFLIEWVILLIANIKN